MVGLSAILCAIYVAQYAHVSAKDRATFDPVSFSLTGSFFAQLAIGVLGVLVITNEYGSGMIRATFAAVPQRLTVLAAKATVFAGVTFVVMTAACFVAFFVGQMILSTKGHRRQPRRTGALRTVIGTGLYLAVLGLLALGAGHHHPKDGRGHRRGVRSDLRPARHRQPAAQFHELDPEVLAQQRRPGPDRKRGQTWDVRRPPVVTVGRLRSVLPLRRYHPRDRGLDSPTSRRLTDTHFPP